MKLKEVLQAPVYFISGIDTDAGKSVATGYLSSRLLSEGVNVITQKLIQTGNVGMSEDIQLHRKIEGRSLQEVDHRHLTHPLLFPTPCSPHMAAELEHTEVDITLATRATEELKKLYPLVLIEGAGGLMVPLTEELLTIEYIEEQHYPVVLVTTAKLGSINHTLLSLEALQRRGIEVPLLIYNMGVSTEPAITENTLEYLQKYLAKHYPATHLLELPTIDL